MEENWRKAIDWLKGQEIKACITGSSVIKYFEGADVDVFCYDAKSFTKLFYGMWYNPMFQILDPLEEWKANRFMDVEEFKKGKFGVTTIKFKYNLCIDVNIILKQGADSIFNVLSSFDMDIVCKGYDIETKQTLDLSERLEDNKATWNKWNPVFYSKDIWSISRILRQLERGIKYHKRGYNTDLVVEKYLELITHIEDFSNIFSSTQFEERLYAAKEDIKIVKELCLKWLESHTITDEELNQLRQLIKDL